jgi:hypothetical protein
VEVENNETKKSFYVVIQINCRTGKKVRGKENVAMLHWGIYFAAK